MRTIIFEFPIAEIHLSSEDFDGYETEEFEYDYDSQIFYDAAASCFSEDYGIDKDSARRIIEDFDLWDAIEDQYGLEIEETIKEQLYDEAYKAWRGGE
jgi:hypothetical protein